MYVSVAYNKHTTMWFAACIFKGEDILFKVCTGFTAKLIDVQKLQYRCSFRNERRKKYISA